jgi:RNAse (barnase) inhibitor barstar
MSRRALLVDILGRAEGNGLYRVTDVAAIPGAVRLSGRQLTDKAAMLEAVSTALRFPDYFGFNWDALDECLCDLSWHDGPVALLVEDAAVPEEQAPEAWDILLDALAGAARFWRAEGRPFSVFLRGGHAAYPLLAA